MNDAPYLNCDGCRGTTGRAGCPTHRQNNAVTIAPSVQWSSSEPVLTHCRHGLDLRINPRCYLCRPAAPAEGLDMERLARAVMTTDSVPMPKGWHGYVEWADRIAREYAALVKPEADQLAASAEGLDLDGKPFCPTGSAQRFHAIGECDCAARVQPEDDR